MGQVVIVTQDGGVQTVVREVAQEQVRAAQGEVIVISVYSSAHVTHFGREMVVIYQTVQALLTAMAKVTVIPTLTINLDVSTALTVWERTVVDLAYTAEKHRNSVRTVCVSHAILIQAVKRSAQTKEHV